MNSEKLEAMFEMNDDEYLKFERIPESERLALSKDLCGLLKLASLLKSPIEFEYHAEHDVLYLADAKDLKELTQEDVIYLSRCGFHYDGEYECIADFC